MNRPPPPPFTAETASQKARLAEDAWNTPDPAKVALAYSVDSVWRNRAEFIHGREAIEAFLTRKWSRELEYRLIKEVWAFHDNRIAVRFATGWRRFALGVAQPGSLPSLAMHLVHVLRLRRVKRLASCTRPRCAARAHARRGRLLGPNFYAVQALGAGAGRADLPR
jgi:hypothetical protein